nr:hypothetical protein [uncultured Rhodoferax sp.]
MLTWLCTLGVCLVPAAVGAQTGEDSSALRLSGFGTLGVVHNDNSDAGVVYSSAQKNPAHGGWSGNLDTVLGVQADWQLSSSTSLVAQAVARAGDEGEAKMRMAYVRQQWGNDMAVRVGRMRSPLFFDSDVSEIGYAYLPMRASMPVYSPINSVDHLDGADLQWRHGLGDAVLMVQAYYGSSDYKHRFYNLKPVQDADVQLKDIGGAALSVTWPSVTMRISHTTTGAYQLRSAQTSQLNAGLAQIATALNGMGASAQAAKVTAMQNMFDSRPTYTSIGMDAYRDAWRFMAEVTQLDTQAELTGRYAGYQLTLGRSLGSFTPYVAYGRLMRNTALFDTRALSGVGADTLKAQLDGAARFADLSMSTASIGVRWDVAANVDFKVQLDHIETPDKNIPGYLTTTTLPFNNRVRLLSATMDFVF